MSHTIEYYRAKGFDQTAAEYFAGERKRIVAASPNDGFTLTIRFVGGETRLYDMRPLLQKGTVLEPITKIENFRRVFVDEQHCVAWDIDPAIDSKKVWSNSIDLCPDGCCMDSHPL